MANNALSPKQAARFLGHGREFVMSLIQAQEIAAEDHRRPGAAKPRYAIDVSELIRWKQSRRVNPSPTHTQREHLQIPVARPRSRKRLSRLSQPGEPSA